MAWGRVWRGFVLLVALATAVAGLLLIAPKFSPLPIPPLHYAVAGGFLIYLAVVIVWNGVIRSFETGWFLSNILAFALFGCLAAVAASVVAIAVGVQAVLVRQWLVASLLLPGCLGLWAGFYLYQYGPKQTRNAAAVENAPEPEPEMTPDAGRRPNFWEGLSSIASGPLLILPLAYLFLLFPLTVIAIGILGDILLHGAFMPVEALPARIWEQLLRFWPKFQFLFWMLLAFGAFIGIGSWFGMTAPLGFGRDANRLLSPDEMSFVERAKAEVAAFAEKNGWPGRRRRRITLAIVPGAAIAALLAGAAALYHFSPLLPPPPSQGWYRYLPVFDSEIFFLGLWMFPFFCFSIPLSSFLAGKLSKRFAEYDGWYGMTAKSAMYGVEARLLIWLRRRRIGPDQLFDPARFLRQAGHFFAPLWLAVLALYAAAVVYVGVHDQMAILVTEQGVTVPDNWTFATRRYAYRDVDGVWLYCDRSSRHDRIYGYLVQFRDGSDIVLARSDQLRKHLDVLLALDSRLVRARVPFTIGVDSRVKYVPSCVKSLAKDEGGDDTARVLRLFHYDGAMRLLKR